MWAVMHGKKPGMKQKQDLHELQSTIASLGGTIAGKLPKIYQA